MLAIVVRYHCCHPCLHEAVIIVIAISIAIAFLSPFPQLSGSPQAEMREEDEGRRQTFKRRQTFLSKYISRYIIYDMSYGLGAWNTPQDHRL